VVAIVPMTISQQTGCSCDDDAAVVTPFVCPKKELGRWIAESRNLLTIRSVALVSQRSTSPRSPTGSVGMIAGTNSVLAVGHIALVVGDGGISASALREVGAVAALAAAAVRDVTCVAR